MQMKQSYSGLVFFLLIHGITKCVKRYTVLGQSSLAKYFFLILTMNYFVEHARISIQEGRN